MQPREREQEDGDHCRSAALQEEDIKDSPLLSPMILFIRYGLKTEPFLLSLRM